MDRTAREVVRSALAEYHPPVVDTDLDSTGDGRVLAPASVLVLVYDRGGDSVVLLSKRSESLETHPGEISFPGGRCETTDESLLHTALREAEEEVGVSAGDVDVLGELGQFTTVSDYLISTFVGTIDHPYDFTVNLAEVAELVEVPVPALLDQRNVRDEVRVVDGDLAVMPAFAYAGHLIFGATARILDRLLEVVLRDGTGRARLVEAVPSTAAV